MSSLLPVLKALSDPSRLRIFGLLQHAGELCVCDIEAALHFSQTKVSRQLGLLKKAGLVSDRRKGPWILYSVTSPSTSEGTSLRRTIIAALKSDPIAQKDQRELARIIKRGSCAAAIFVRPRKSVPTSAV